MKLGIIIGEHAKFFEATRAWQNRHNYLNGNLVSASWPISATHYELGSFIQLNEQDKSFPEIVRCIAIASGIKYFEQVC